MIFAFSLWSVKWKARRKCYAKCAIILVNAQTITVNHVFASAEYHMWASQKSSEKIMRHRNDKGGDVTQKIYVGTQFMILLIYITCYIYILLLAYLRVNINSCKKLCNICESFCIILRHRILGPANHRLCLDELFIIARMVSI